MDSKKRILTLLFDDLLADNENFQETLQYINDTAYYLKKGETQFEKDLGKEIKDKIDEIVSEKDLCPDCFAETDWVQTFGGDYLNPPEGVVTCKDDCGWHQ